MSTMSNGEFTITNDLKYRQICAVLIQDLGIMHNVSQSLINTAVVYMHKLYEKFSYKDLKPVYVAMTSFYLASKSEDCARKLNDIVKAVYVLAGKQLDSQSERVVAAVHALESIMLMSVGFPKLDFKHPHVLILQLTKNYEINNTFYETAYYLCTAMLHLTTLITRYNTEEIAAASIYIACKWDYLELKDVSHRPWFKYINPNITIAKIKDISREFLEIYVKTPTRLKQKAVQFLKRFNNVTVNRPPNKIPTPKPSSSEYVVKETVEKEEPLEEGEIDQASGLMTSTMDKNRQAELNNQNKKLSLHQYYQRKEDTVHKPSPNSKYPEMPKSYSQSESHMDSEKYNQHLQKRKQDSTNRSLNNSNKLMKLDHHHRKVLPESSRDSSSYHTHHRPHHNHHTSGNKFALGNMNNPTASNHKPNTEEYYSSF